MRKPPGILVRTGPDNDRGAWRLAAGLLFLFAWTLFCQTIIYDLIPLFYPSEDPLESDVGYLVSKSGEVACLVLIAFELIRTRPRRGLLWPCASVALFATSAVSLWHDFHDPWSGGQELFGHVLETDKYPIAGRMAYIIVTFDWTQACTIIALLISISRRVRPGWTWIAALFCVGQFLDQIVFGGFGQFIPQCSTASEWFRYAALISTLIALIGLAGRWFVRWVTLLALLTGVLNSVGELAFAWISPNPYSSRFNQLQYQWCSTLSIIADVGLWVLITWFAWRRPIVRLPDDGSPWPRRYCAKCYYNLHGVEVERCPECGASLMPVRGETACPAGITPTS